MAGNFSFGDYFKAEAIQLAWDCRPSRSTTAATASTATASGSRCFPTTTRRSTSGTSPSASRWSASSSAAWTTTSGRWASPARAVRAASSTTTAAPTTARRAGPRSTKTATSSSGTSCSCRTSAARQSGPGKSDYPILGELPKKNIDTGMGMERMATLLQGVDNLYEIDQTRPILDRRPSLPARSTARTPGTRPPIRPRRRPAAGDRRPRPQRADAHRRRRHAGQRRPRLRAAPHHPPGRPLDAAARLRRASLPELLPVARDCMAPSYPELATDFDRISAYAYAEEDAFRATLRAGTSMFDLAVSGLTKANTTTPRRRPGVPAARHLRLPDRPDPGDGGRAGHRRRRARAFAG